VIYLAYKNNSFVILLPKDADDFFTKPIDCNGSNNWLNEPKLNPHKNV